jgi:hypothetical protein
MSKRTKINLYCSIISSENYNEEGGYYSFAPNFGEQAQPKEVEWVYGGGALDCALKPLRVLPEDGVEVTMFTESQNSFQLLHLKKAIQTYTQPPYTGEMRYGDTG